MDNKLCRCWTLVNVMSQRERVDLASAYLEGTVSRSYLLEVLQACADCPHLGECDASLTQATEVERFRSVPEHCLAKPLIEALHRSR